MALTLFDYWESGNCYKVRLLLARLEIPYERVPVDILAGESRTPAFLARNPNGRVPTVVFDDGRALAESNAILLHLARATAFWPADPWEQSQIYQWLFFEQYSHEPFIAVLRFWHFSGSITDHSEEEIAAKRAGGDAALRVMEQRLASADFLVGARCTIADLALYAYTHVAPEGQFDLAPYPGIRAWLARVEQQPRHCSIHD